MAEDPTQSDNPDGADRPDWLPDNFRTGEDLANSYKESQRKITEEATARRNLEQLVAQQQTALEEARAAQAPPPQEEPWEDWYAQDPIATQKALAEQAAEAKFTELWQKAQAQTQPIQASQTELVANEAFRALAEERTVTPEIKEAMSVIYNENPHLIPESAIYSPVALKNALGIVYDLAEKKIGPQDNSPSLESIRRDMKLQAQSTDGATPRPGSPEYGEQRWQEIANAQTNKLGL